MLLLFCYLPISHVYFREPGISLLGFLFDEGSVDSVSQGHRPSIDAFPADDKDLLLLGFPLECFFQRIIEHDVVTMLLHVFSLSCDDHVATVGQGIVGQRLKGLASHDDRMPGGESLEVSHILGQMPRQSVTEANGPLA